MLTFHLKGWFLSRWWPETGIAFNHFHLEVRKQSFSIFNTEHGLGKFALYGLRLWQFGEPSSTHPPKLSKRLLSPELISAFASSCMNCCSFKCTFMRRIPHNTTRFETFNNQFQWRSKKASKQLRYFETHYLFLTHLDLLCSAWTNNWYSTFVT